MPRNGIGHAPSSWASAAKRLQSTSASTSAGAISNDFPRDGDDERLRLDRLVLLGEERRRLALAHPGDVDPGDGHACGDLVVRAREEHADRDPEEEDERARPDDDALPGHGPDRDDDLFAAAFLALPYRPGRRLRDRRSRCASALSFHRQKTSRASVFLTCGTTSGAAARGPACARSSRTRRTCSSSRPFSASGTSAATASRASLLLVKSTRSAPARIDCTAQRRVQSPVCTIESESVIATPSKPIARRRLYVFGFATARRGPSSL